MGAQDLDARLLAAHTRQDAPALVRLYTEAGTRAAGTKAEPFYLTHAFVFALEIGAPEAVGLRARLVALGSEPAEPL